MNRTNRLLCVLLFGTLLFGMAVVSANDDDEKNQPKVTVKGGVRGASEEGNLGRVAEYSSITDGLDAGFSVEQVLTFAYYEAMMEFYDDEELMALFHGDIERKIRFEGSLNRFVHRLEHDPLSNLQAVKTPKVTRSTDMAPGREYGITYTDMRVGMEFQLPEAPALTFGFNVREQVREGHKQTRTLSHCANCHVVGYDTYINQVTRDYMASVDFNQEKVQISAKLMARTFEEEGDTPMHQYDDVLHPTKVTPVFFDRVTFWDAFGQLPHNLVPKGNKTKLSLTAGFDGGSAGRFGAGFVYSQVEDEYTSNTMSFTGLRGSWANRLGDNVSLRARGVYYTIDNDDYFYDAFEPAAQAGPYAGQTYRERWGAEADLNRWSAYNRDTVRFDAGLTWRFGARNVFNLEYYFENVDREHYEVTEGGDTETTTNRIKGSLTLRAGKNTRIHAYASYKDVDQPFIGVNAAGTPNFDPEPVSSPLAGGSIQYFQLYAARLVDLTNQPNSEIELKGSLHHKLGSRAAVSATGLYRDSTNDVLDFSEWNKEKTMLNANAWFALSPELYGTFSYTYGDETTETLFILPIFDG